MSRQTLRMPAHLAKRTIPLTDNARFVIQQRYIRKNARGEPVETIPEMFWRVAWHVAEAEDIHGGDREAWALCFFDLLTSLRFLPNTPTFTGAGTPLGQLAACFVLPLEDDLGKIREGIFNILRQAALIQQSGGGNGFPFHKLRPRGTRIHTTGGWATGPVGFLRVFSFAFEEIARGGIRRGANMAVLRVDHPDIEEFIRSKEREGELANFNISVGITDAFMEAVEQDAVVPLINPQRNLPQGKIRATRLFEEIAQHAHANGEPGVLFMDTANRTNPLPHLYRLEATNPCGEQWLGPYENCCLGHVNLAAHLEKTASGYRINWEKLAESVRQGTRFLDDVVTANRYVPAVPELREAGLRARRIGLGIMGLADVFFALRIRYGSPESEDLASQIMEWIRYHCMRTSIDLARERGPFPAIQGSIYDQRSLVWEPPTPLIPFTSDYGRPPVDWNRIVEGIQKHGIRNAGQTTIAPTGTVSTVAGVEGYGCEPAFALVYTRKVFVEDRWVELLFMSHWFVEALREEGLAEDAIQRIQEKVALTGSCQQVEEVPEHLRNVFVVALDISPEEHVRMQAALQRFVDNSISKTINFPPEATVEDVKKAYMLGWKLGCKGLTVYVAGSRKLEVLEIEAQKNHREQAMICPECYHRTLHQEQGRLICTNCGYSTTGPTAITEQT